MPTLTTIPDLARRLHQAERRVHGHPILHEVLEGAEEAILKLREHGLCEVLGYQLAGLLGVPVPRHQRFWTTSRTSLRDVPLLWSLAKGAVGATP